MTKLHAAFVLAAGLGERLRPVTDAIPKPLVPLCGKPCIERAIEQVMRCHPVHLCVNLHYKAEAIRSWAAGSPYGERIQFYHESEIQGTGGALKNAAPLLSGGTFLVLNSDIVSDIDLAVLLRRHRTEGNLVTLAVHDHPQFNTVCVAADGMFAGLVQHNAAQPESGLKAFTGIAIYEMSFLDFLPAGVSRVTDAWQRARDAGHRVAAADVSGCAWSDIGTPATYAKAVFDLLLADGETVFIHPSAKGCGRSDYQGYVVAEAGSKLDGAKLKNCVVLPGCDVSGQHIENALVHAGGILPLSASDLFSRTGDGVVEIGAGGSDRRYFRIEHGGSSAVLLQCARRDEEFERQAAYAKFFAKQGVRVPRLSSIAAHQAAMLFEDLGDISLYSWLRCSRSEGAVEAMYRKVIDQLAQLHAVASANVHDCPLLAERVFDYDYLRWETVYFYEQFVIGLLGRDDIDRRPLDEEFHLLAQSVDAAPRTIIHRDCQSQNIMLKNNAEVCLIDFQGARLLTPAYDIVSLLWDPYYRLDGALRERLVTYYRGEMQSRSDTFDDAAFRHALLPCRLQRHMQALGAYGFLSQVKGKRSFLKHVPEGMRLLKEDAREVRDRYPALAALISGLEVVPAQ
ncbi:MAG TPA: phosphotransferase [Dissulfurispiraceae bacterium]|nr:phosphotransferase [Dissulfurispiraceae bacterium]